MHIDRRLLFTVTLTMLLVCGCDQKPTVEVPEVDLTGARPETAKKFDVARRSVMENPDSAAKWGKLGMVFNAHEFLDEALKCYRRAADLDPEEFRWIYLAAIVTAEQDPQEAENLFRRAAKVDDRYPPLYCNLAATLVKLGRDDDARREYEHALRLNPKCRAALIGLGELYLQKGDLEKSRKHLLQAADLNFRDHDVHAILARLYRQMGDAKATEIETNLMRTYKQSAPIDDQIRAEAYVKESTGLRTLRNQGEVFVESGRFAEAEHVLLRVVQLPDATAFDHMLLGHSMAEQGKLSDGIKQLKIAADMDDQDARVLATYGLFLSRAGKLEEGGRQLKKALELDPDSDVAQFYAAMNLERQGEIEQATKGFQRVVELNPANADGHLYLANILASQQKLDQAVQHWQLALVYRPGYPRAVASLSRAYYQQGHYDKADALLRAEFDRTPRSPTLLMALASHLANCPAAQFRDSERAIRLAEKLVATRGINKVQSLVFLSTVLAQADEIQRALAALKIAEETNVRGPNDPRVAEMIQIQRNQYLSRQQSSASQKDR